MVKHYILYIATAGISKVVPYLKVYKHLKQLQTRTKRYDSFENDCKFNGLPNRLIRYMWVFHFTIILRTGLGFLFRTYKNVSISIKVACFPSVIIVFSLVQYVVTHTFIGVFFYTNSDLKLQHTDLVITSGQIKTHYQPMKNVRCSHACGKYVS